MNIVFSKKMAIKYLCSDEKFQKKNMAPGEIYEVIGYEYYNKRDNNNMWKRCINFIVLDDNNKLEFIPHFSGEIIIIEETNKQKI